MWVGWSGRLLAIRPLLWCCAVLLRSAGSDAAPCGSAGSGWLLGRGGDDRELRTFVFCARTLSCELTLLGAACCATRHEMTALRLTSVGFSITQVALLNATSSNPTGSSRYQGL